MDYNSSIPDIYDQRQITNQYSFDIEKEYISLVSYEYKKLKFKNNLFVYIETEFNNIYLNDIKICNKRIIFNNNLDNYNLYNKSDYIATIIINYVSTDKFIKKIMSCDWNGYHIEKKELEKLNIIILTTYVGIGIRDKIFIQTRDEIVDKIIKIHRYNIIMYYNIKLISKNILYSYELTLCGIKNTFLDEYMIIDLNFENIHEIYPKYLYMFKQLEIFLQKNIEYINKNNVDIPTDIKDPDDWKNYMFYSGNMETIIKKYNLVNYDTYRLHIYN